MSYFEPDETIFADQDVLRDDYQPDELEGRNEELEKYKTALQPVIDGAQPRNIFVYGKTGVGKTAATKFLLERLRVDVNEYYPEIDLSTVVLNCNGLTSSYQVAVHLVNEIVPPEEEMAPTGHPTRAVYERLWEEINRLGGTVLIVLDEIDAIGTDDELLYELPRARSNGYVTESRPGVIGISNDFSFRETLSPKVEDTLCERELHFPPYDATELRTILEQRSELAFYDDVLDSGVLSLCAAMAAKDRGSARQALDLLFEAGDLARSRDDEAVTVEHVQEARRVLEEKKIDECMHELTLHGHLVLCAVVILAGKELTPARSRDINDRYTELAKHIEEDPLSLRSVHSHLSDLRMLGILTADEHNVGRQGGSYLRYQLAVPRDAAIDALEERFESARIDISKIRTLEPSST